MITASLSSAVVGQSRRELVDGMGWMEIKGTGSACFRDDAA